MIHVEGINKSFASEIVLKNFSYSFEKSKTTVILGQSGSGKSTLIRLITGLEKADSGNISVDRILLKLNLFIRSEKNWIM